MSHPPHRVVEDFETRLQEVESEFQRAYWDSQIHASPDNDRRRADLELQLRSLKGDAATLAAVNHALDEGAHEPILRRQLEVMRSSLTGNQMSEAQRVELVELSIVIESEFARYRANVGDKELDENEVVNILRTSDDVELRQATYLSSKQIGRQIGERVRELARLRNAAASELGFRDYYAMSLELQELPERWLFDLFQELDAATSDVYASWKDNLDAHLRERFHTADLFPWHYSDPFFQHLPSGEVSFDEELKPLSTSDLATETFARWGIDLRPVLERSDLFPRQLKSEEAFCIDIDRSGEDVRILANVIPGERWITIMLHECGHAAYDISVDRRLPYLLRQPAHIFVTEGMAVVAERLVRDPRWLTEVAGLGAEQVTERAHALKVASARQSILFARWALVVSHFERSLYADPESDLDEVWWELVERFQFVRRPDVELRDAWASKIHIVDAPVYYQNYLLGELLASQLEETLTNRTGSLLNPEAGEILQRDLFAPGASRRWETLIEEATGRSLTPAFFAAHAGD